MTPLERVDARFALHLVPRRAVVLGDLDDWRAGLEQVGAELVGEHADDVDLAVAPATQAPAAARVGARAVLVEGDARRALGSTGLPVRRLLALPAADRVSLVAPLDPRAPAEYALGQWTVADRRWKTVRNTLALRAATAGAPLPGRILTLAAPHAPPFLVEAAAELGIDRTGGWFLVAGEGDALARGVLQVFRPGEPMPAWAIKFARVQGYEAPFERDRLGLELAAGSTSAARCAPRFIGRMVVEGMHASVETAAAGRRLIAFLHGPASPAAKRRVLDRVAGWLGEVGTETSSAAVTLAPALAVLRERTLPAWNGRVPAGLVERLRGVPAVLQHHDLGTWNVVVHGDEFTVVDWESARRHGFPLWDLLYFLTDALAHLDGARDRVDHLLRLCRGELSSSPLLFSSLRGQLAALGVAPEAVGSLAALLWLYEGGYTAEREAAVEHFADRDPGGAHGLYRRVAEAWLSDPALGVEWDRWRG